MYTTKRTAEKKHVKLETGFDSQRLLKTAIKIASTNTIEENSDYLQLLTDIASINPKNSRSGLHDIITYFLGPEAKYYAKLINFINNLIQREDGAKALFIAFNMESRLDIPFPLNLIAKEASPDIFLPIFIMLLKNIDMTLRTSKNISLKDIEKEFYLYPNYINHFYLMVYSYSISEWEDFISDLLSHKHGPSALIILIKNLPFYQNTVHLKENMNQMLRIFLSLLENNKYSFISLIIEDLSNNVQLSIINPFSYFDYHFKALIGYLTDTPGMTFIFKIFAFQRNILLCARDIPETMIEIFSLLREQPDFISYKKTFVKKLIDDKTEGSEDFNLKLLTETNLKTVKDFVLLLLSFPEGILALTKIISYQDKNKTLSGLHVIGRIAPTLIGKILADASMITECKNYVKSSLTTLTNGLSGFHYMIYRVKKFACAEQVILFIDTADDLIKCLISIRKDKSGASVKCMTDLITYAPQCLSTVLDMLASASKWRKYVIMACEENMELIKNKAPKCVGRVLAMIGKSEEPSLEMKP